MIQDDAVDADQAAFADGAAVQHGMVADGDIATDREWRSGIGVQRRAILDVAALADRDQLRVAPNHDIEPDACVVRDDHRSDDRRVLGDVPLLTVYRDLPFAKRIDSHVCRKNRV